MPTEMMGLHQNFLINYISKFLLGVYEETINKGSLPTSIRQCVITLIPKHQKDILLLENRQPIS